MKYKSLVTHEFSLPILGYGTWKIGGKKERDPFNNDLNDISAIKNAIKSGITHIDTASSYAGGHSEELIGQAIQDFNRSNLFITSKVSKSELEYKSLIQSCKETLLRLRTTYLDLYLIHWPNPDIPLRESMKAMDDLVDYGLIRNIGLSNFTVTQIEEAQSLTKNKIVALQLHYSLICREPEKRGLLKFCQNNDMLFIAWRPLQGGRLPNDKSDVMLQMCKKYNKTPAQISLNWLISQRNVVAITKIGDPKHLSENIGALDWQMSDEDIEELREEYPYQEETSDFRPLSSI